MPAPRSTHFRVSGSGPYEVRRIGGGVEWSGDNWMDAVRAMRRLQKSEDGTMPKKKNAPKRHKRGSITLRNMKSVTIKRRADGTVLIKGTRKKTRKR